MNYDDVISFFSELESLKKIQRKTKSIGLERYENSAEHSWVVSMLALALHDKSRFPVDITKVILMLLIHDIGEIQAGDKILYSDEHSKNKIKEEACVNHVFSTLSENLRNNLICLWREFEFGNTNEAVFARSVDRIPPIIQNLKGAGHSWKENHISLQQVLEKNKCISDALPSIWKCLEEDITKRSAELFEITQ